VRRVSFCDERAHRKAIKNHVDACPFPPPRGAFLPDVTLLAIFPRLRPHTLDSNSRTESRRRFGRVSRVPDPGALVKYRAHVRDETSRRKNLWLIAQCEKRLKEKNGLKGALTGKSEAPPVKSRAFTGAIAPITTFGRFRLDR
jgi:hypothetical protein